ncbi:MAG: hypothetical protein COU22_02005 [Candidatus Komeilibacteria bacterium CG10_big_fil_rev_8_21_14_0_10_41_13]|uniref:Uncharacterized protein n=1 Tax=Candidatus Komeilibacteria bacterium CG10_big_fil_rev_8_21_14_0_10_41_13 TaxID=1974476 RepID=A0A2M6WCF7_9BACT|nr:MAG: hypothetical protein COU22_02005 [Candidatus Komeilibacteria bacterium CG10_big_fil_rev_8_21_14_0_10_41_13]
MKKYPHSLSGLYQALGLVGYCSLVTVLIRFFERTGFEDSSALAPVFFLLLLSVSVAACALIVFGYPASLALKGKVKEALNVLLYTLLYCLGFGAIILVFVFLI